MTQPERHAALLVLEGHIIDSLMLPQLLDLVMDRGGAFDIQELRVGHVYPDGVDEAGAADASVVALARWLLDQDGVSLGVGGVHA